MPDFYLTFGTAHTRDQHPHLAVEAHPDAWVTIEADDYSTARAAAMYLCGIHWCWLYAHADDPQPRREGLAAMLDSFITPVMRWRYFPAGELARYHVKATLLPQDDVILDVDLVNLPIGVLTQK